MAVITPHNLRSRSFESYSMDISSATNLREALLKAGADFKVGRTHLYAKVSGLQNSVLIRPDRPDINIKVVEIPDAMAMWRLGSDGAPASFLATVGPQYTPLQNEEAFRCAETFAGAGAKWDRAYVSSDSGTIYLRLKVAEAFILGDQYAGYTTLINSHDGSTGFSIFDIIQRTACTNSQKVGTRHIRKKHTKSIEFTFDQVKTYMNGLQNSFAELAALAEAARKIDMMAEGRWTGLVENLLPYGEGTDEKARKIVDEQRSILHHAFDARDLDNFRHSGWAAIQAVSDFTSHLGDARKPGSVDNQVRKIVEAVQGHPMLDKAIELVMSYN